MGLANDRKGAHASEANGGADGGPLRMLVWDGMPAAEALAVVAERVGVALDCEPIATNEQLEARLLAGERFDLITPSDFMIERLAGRGLLTPLDPSLLPGRDALAPWVRRPPWDPQERWAVPLAFGTTGYLYDRDRLPGAGGWRALLAPPAGVTVGLLDEPREVIGAALLAVGERFEATGAAALARARELLLAQAAAGAYARRDSGDFVTPVRDGSVAAHHAWGGAAAAAVRAEPRRLAYAVPQEGVVVWVTTVAIAAGCARPGLAHAAIAALLDPQVARLNVERAGHATPNAAAQALLPPQLRDDPVLFPPAAVLERRLTVRDLDADAAARIDALWAELVAAVG
ncbi:extracellular solute-binding protein [Conexibacter sp. JD483]|uniref:extracellular solute-binding protein n=1 Tax=unclassified Conexibacter TaxID=2627773 RepID=UPI0027263E81|nr:MULTISPECIES: extracellular solute-binding protein [unclassified Conexibacter]MDO8189132.1 extracellular solute-binding protein [Conexibacter sp. CPCC 205706]MDO8201850.1 extracellular solute-binding protein [Conexibacter sp. CPCC 205762]MDR9371840.1 extracellular solute-binding protein [Conexibacter sp. JD483]